MNPRIIEEIEADLEVSFKNFRSRIKYLRDGSKIKLIADDPLTLIPEENVPPIMLMNELEEPEAHCIVDGQYVPEPLAKIIFHQRKLLREFAHLRFLNSEWGKYKKRKENALHERKKTHHAVIR